MNTRTHTTVLLLLMLAGISSAQVYRPAYEKLSLPNGLNVVFHRDTTLPFITINTAFRAGSGWDPNGLHGIATVSGNMLLAALPAHAASELARIQKEASASYGSMTAVDWTNLTLTYPKQYLDAALWIESERLKTAGESVTKNMLEQNVSYLVARAAESARNPLADVQDALYKELYPEGHPYAHLSTGDSTQLRKLTLADVQKFMKIFYTPANGTICVAGDFRIDDAKRIVRKYFGSIPPGKKMTWPADAKQLQPSGPVSLIKEAPVDFSTLQLSFPTTFMGHGDQAALDLLAKVLAGAPDARLKKVLLDFNPGVLDVAAAHRVHELHGVFTITISCKREAQLRAVFEQTMNLIREMGRKAVTDDELSMARALAETEFLMPLETSYGFGGRCDILNLGNLYSGNPAMLFQAVENYGRVNRLAVRDAAMRYITAEHVIAISIVPNGKSELGVNFE